MSRRPKKTTRRAWIPMQRGRLNDAYFASAYPDGLLDGVKLEVWGNDMYEATVEHHPNGWAYISLKRYDRHAVRDWRHLQSIKNEVVGPEREAFEIFPAESRLMDQANQYHLWVLPEGESITLGPSQRAIGDPEDARAFGGRARQREWQPGLSTGPEVDAT